MRYEWSKFQQPTAVLSARSFRVAADDAVVATPNYWVRIRYFTSRTGGSSFLLGNG